MSKFDIKISVVENKDEIDGYETSYCKLNFTGKDINHVIINTIRRVILTLVPIYGFDSENINITKNTSVFNNDQLRIRFSNFPIFFNKVLNNKYKNLKKLEYDCIINPESTLNKFSELEYRSNLGSAEIDKTMEYLNKQDISDNLTITVNVKNNFDNDIMNVMTDTPGVKYMYGKEQISHIYANPLLIVQLQPGQEIVFNMVSSLNNSIYNALFRSCSRCHYEEIDDNTFDLSIYSRRQLSEKDIILRSCKIIKQKIINSENTIINNIKNQLDDDHLKDGNILIEGEQHTLGNLLSRFLQDHKDIIFAGYKVGHPNVNQVEIRYDCNTNIINIIKDVCNKIYNLFDDIENKIQKLDNFGYKYI